MVFMYLASLQGVACFSCSRRLPDLATSENPAVMSINVLKHWWRISTFIETKEGSLTGLFCWLSLELLQQQMSCSWMSHCSASCRGSMMFAIVLLWLSAVLPLVSSCLSLVCYWRPLVAVGGQDVREAYVSFYVSTRLWSGHASPVMVSRK